MMRAFAAIDHVVVWSPNRVPLSPHGISMTSGSVVLMRKLAVRRYWPLHLGRLVRLTRPIQS